MRLDRHDRRSWRGARRQVCRRGPDSAWPDRSHARAPGRTQRNQNARAGHLKPRTLEHLTAQGLIDHFMERGTPVEAIHFGGVSPALDYSNLDSRFPFHLNISQNVVEEILEMLLRDAGADLRFGHEVTAARDEETHSVVSVRSGTSMYEIEAEYVLGCDGGSNIVRKAASIGISNRGSQGSFLLADLELERPPEELPHFFSNDQGSLIVQRWADGGFRVIRFDPALSEINKETPVMLDGLKESIRVALGPIWGHGIRNG